MTNQTFLESTLKRVKDAKTIGVTPLIPTLIQEYVDIIASVGEKPDKIYLATMVLYFDHIESKELAEGFCNGLTLSRIHWSRSIGVPTFRFNIDLKTVNVGHYEPGFLASTHLMNRLRLRYPDLLAYDGSIICPYFLTETYTRDSRALSPDIRVEINDKLYSLYDKYSKVVSNNYAHLQILFGASDQIKSGVLRSYTNENNIVER